MRITGLALALALAAPMAAADPIDSKSARKHLFSTKGATAQMGQVDFIDGAVAKAIKQAASQIPYYGAIAVSPGEPTSSQLMSTMANFHSAEAAQTAALANCNSRRTVGKPCVVIATITPRKYKAKPLTMSVEATKAFDGAYRKLKAPKGLAISPSTGVFGFDRGDGGRAISLCNAAAAEKGAKDCKLVISDQ